MTNTGVNDNHNNITINLKGFIMQKSRADKSIAEHAATIYNRSILCEDGTKAEGIKFTMKWNDSKEHKDKVLELAVESGIVAYRRVKKFKTAGDVPKEITVWVTELIKDTKALREQVEVLKEALKEKGFTDEQIDAMLQK